MQVIDGRAWALDLSRLPTYSSVSKEYPTSPNGKSDPQAAFCGYPDNDGGFQLGYSLLFIVDFKTELPFALLFAGGQVQDGPLAETLLDQACTPAPHLGRTLPAGPGRWRLRLDPFLRVHPAAFTCHPACHQEPAQCQRPAS